jgi:hypothetical protein
MIFGSVWFLSKKITKPNLKKTKTGSNRPVSVLFLRQKPVQGLARFSRFGSVFSGWLDFFIWIQFSFFDFRLRKIKTKPVDFFKIFIDFFSWFGFFSFFFPVFLIFHFFFSPLSNLTLKTSSNWLSVFFFFFLLPLDLSLPPIVAS